METYHVIIIGGGGTGAALAHDLTLRGFRVTLFERGEVTSGTTGRHHGLLHSGARYAVNDKDSARECIEENRILRHIAPGSFEENDGLFVAISESDYEYRNTFLAGCAECNIPTRVLTREQTLRLEPYLNPELKMAVQVPDATMDAMRLPLRFFATAKKNGADIRPFHEVIGILRSGANITGVRVRDNRSRKEYSLTADIVVNAAGPWCGKVAQLIGIHIPISPSPGVMLTLHGRLCNMVINRLHESGDGDIVVPQRALSIVGTSSWVVDDPDNLTIPEDHIQMMFDKGSELIPQVRHTPVRAISAAVRPLIGAYHDEGSGRRLSRTFKCFDHEHEGAKGFFTITGGKATTLRMMAEITANEICRKVGIDAPCQTRDVVLLPHTQYYC